MKNTGKKILAATLAAALLFVTALTGCGTAADTADAADSSSVSEAAGTAEPAETAADESDLDSFESAMGSRMGNSIELFNTLAVGESVERTVGGCYVTVTKAQENLLISQVLSDGSTINSEIVQFLYPHNDGYQLQMYLTRAEDAVQTISVMDVSADGETITPLYVSTNNDTDETVTLNMSDIMKGEPGTIEIDTVENEDGTVSKTQTIRNDDGTVVLQSRTEIVKDGNNVSVRTVVLKDDDAIADIDFDRAFTEDGVVHTVQFADQDGICSLSYQMENGVIDPSTAVLSYMDNVSAMDQAAAEDDIFLLGEMETGTTVEGFLNNTDVTRTKLADDLLYALGTMAGSFTTESFTYAHGDGYQRLCYVNDDESGATTAIVLNVSADGRTLVPIYFSTVDDTAGTSTLQPFMGTNTTVEVNTVENADGTMTVSIAVKDEDGTVLASTEITITATGTGFRAEGVGTAADGTETNVSFVTDGDVHTVTITDSVGTSVLSYTKTDGELQPDSVQFTAE